MISFTALIPFIISFILGFSFYALLVKKDNNIGLINNSVLSIASGLILSSYLTFSSFILFNQLNKTYVIAAHFVLITTFIAILIRQGKLNLKKPSFTIDYKIALSLLAIALALIPTWMHGSFFAYGGWDAWSTWNLKSKMLFLSAADWQRIFDPSLWRSSPHYPLLLPLMNVWTWCFVDQPNTTGPIIVGFIFASLIAVLLYSSLYRLTKTHFAILPSIILLTLPVFIKASISQYADNLLCFLFLTTLFLFIFSLFEKDKSILIPTIFFLGTMAFTKSEGLVASGIIIFFILFANFKNIYNKSKWNIKTLLLFIFICLAPVLIFKLFYAPDNLTFTNGFISDEKPVSFLRLKIIFSFLLIEIGPLVWNVLAYLGKVTEYIELQYSCLWIFFLIAILSSPHKLFKVKLLCLPLFILLYMSVIFAYYFINTHFSIGWWMQVSLYRILTSILPIMLFWIFLGLWKEIERP